MNTRSQRRAASVMNKVQAVKDNQGKSFQDEYGGMAHKLPVLIRTAGLVQALAFVEARGKPGAKQLLADLSADVGTGNHGSLHARSQQADLPEYIHLSQEVLAALLWYKRFSQIILGVKSGDEGGK